MGKDDLHRTFFFKWACIFINLIQPLCVGKQLCVFLCHFHVVLFLGQTSRLIHEGSEIKVGGVKGIFEAEFRAMEDKLDEVRRILSGTNVTQHDLDRLQDSLNLIRYVVA